MMLRAVPSGSIAPVTLRLIVVLPPNRLFGVITPLPVGVNNSGPRSPTRYDVPPITGPPSALPPPNAKSIAPPMACVTGLFLMKLTTALMALNALLTTVTRFANRSITIPIAVPITPNAPPSILPTTGASVSRVNAAMTLNNESNGANFSSFSLILPATFSNADRNPSMIGVKYLPIAGIKYSVMNPQMASNVGIT